MAWSGSGWYADTLKLAIGTTPITLNLESETAHRIALYDTSITPDYSASAPAYSTTGEITGTGYTAGGVVLTTTTLGVSGGYLSWDADSPSWTSSTLTGVRGAQIYADALTGNNLIVGIDFLSSFSTADGTLLITFSANGIARINVIAA